MRNTKVVSLEEAIRRSGLKDGMTISFHHHFRGGDKVVNLVVDKLAEMGFKDLKLAASSLSDVHAPLIEHIKAGVITGISTSGLRGELANAISHGLLKEPVVFRSHGGRGSAIASGEQHIDVAFLGASSCDELGNASGCPRSENAKSICGSLGYALPDAEYANHVVVLTDDLVAYPNVPMSIKASQVESVVVVESVGDSSKISSGAIRDSKNPRDILLAKQAAKVIIASGYFKDGFSIQTGTGGASLAAVKYIRESMIEQGIKASFALGGITAHMVKLHEEGLIDKLIDVQSFDKVAAESIASDQAHQEVSAVDYASADHLGSAVRRQLQRQRSRGLGRHHPRGHRRPSGYCRRQRALDYRMPAAARQNPLRGAEGYDPDHPRFVGRRGRDRIRYSREPGQARDSRKAGRRRAQDSRYQGPRSESKLHHRNSRSPALRR